MKYIYKWENNDLSFHGYRLKKLMYRILIKIIFRILVFRFISGFKFEIIILHYPVQEPKRRIDPLLLYESE